MSEPAADALRAAVARKLRSRRLRWRFFALLVLAEAGILLALARDPVVLIILPAPALLTLVPILFVGRYRLPDEEWEGHPDFAEQATDVTLSFATHTYAPPNTRKDVQEDTPLKIELRRKFRGLRANLSFLVIYDADVFLIMTARSYWVWYQRQLRFGAIESLDIDAVEWIDIVDHVRSDDEIVKSEFRHMTMTGERDRRYKRNPGIHEVRRHGVTLTLDGLSWTIRLSCDEEARAFTENISAIVRQGPALTHLEDAADSNYGIDEVPDEEALDEIEEEDIDGLAGC